MAKLEANIDACRLSNEVLTRLRKIVRDTLRATYGTSWEEEGIPTDIHEFLIQRQAREASINWNLSDSCDALDFAGYLNLSDIIAATPELLQRFSTLAPDADVVRMRFLELDTILNRIAYARPISEADLGLLATFDDRMKKMTTGPLPAIEEAPAPRGRSGRTSHQAPEPAPSAPPSRPVPPAPTPPSGKAAAHVEPPRPAPAPPDVPPAGQPPEPPPTPVPPATVTPEPPPAPPSMVTAPQVGPEDLDAATKRGETKIILTALYQEVTSLADGLWNGSLTTLQPRAWEKVRESPWYRDHFAKLGLKPISDFFGLFDTAKEKTISGASRTQLQDFLKEHNFVQVLLALKELFRQHMRP
ncbi:MAG: hypothetical protein LAO05_00395 [Acidobacteriia bacterium]|nr:hypothetical protein [Terriglobia bacterium]